MTSENFRTGVEDEVPEDTLADAAGSQDGRVDFEIELDDDVYEEVCRLARERGCTVDDIINDALVAAVHHAEHLKAAGGSDEAAD